MIKIATHNSATGEKSASFLDWLLLPFARCQNKTIKEQYEAGCRYFDIRYKWNNKKDCFVCGHGLWTSDRTLTSVLEQINDFGDCYVLLSCETGSPLCKDAILKIIEKYPKIKFTSFNKKKPVWKQYYHDKVLPHINGYRVLDWSSLHTLIPIPWLWKEEPEFRTDIFTFVDFL